MGDGGIGGDAMAKIEDQRAMTQTVKNSIHAFIQRPAAGYNTQGIKIALNCPASLK